MALCSCLGWRWLLYIYIELCSDGGGDCIVFGLFNNLCEILYYKERKNVYEYVMLPNKMCTNGFWIPMSRDCGMAFQNKSISFGVFCVCVYVVNVSNRFFWIYFSQHIRHVGIYESGVFGRREALQMLKIFNKYLWLKKMCIRIRNEEERRCMGI